MARAAQPICHVAFHKLALLEPLLCEMAGRPGSTAPFVGFYTDSTPTGWRLVCAGGAVPELTIRGRDSAGDRSDGAEWEVRAESRADGTIAADLSAVGGAADATARLDANGALLWSDGTRWHRASANDRPESYVQAYAIEERMSDALNAVRPSTLRTITTGPIVTSACGHTSSSIANAQVIRESPSDPMARLAQILASGPAAPTRWCATPAPPTTPYAQRPRRAAGYRDPSATNKKDSDVLNEGQYRLGILKHAPPSFKFFDPIETEGRPLIIKEVTLVTLGNSNR